MAVARFLCASLVVVFHLHSGAAWAQANANDLLGLGTELLRSYNDQQQNDPPAQSTDQSQPFQEQPVTQTQDQAVTQSQPAATQSAPDYDRTQVAEAQALLNRLGYDAGPVDGLMGSRTRRAIETFQRSYGLAPTGRPDDIFLATLRAVPPPAVAPALAEAGPSFDCARAGTPTEFAICGIPALAMLDRRIADSFLRVMATATAAGQDVQRVRQKTWLAGRDACGADVSCLDQSMTARLAALDGLPATDIVTAARTVDSAAGGVLVDTPLPQAGAAAADAAVEPLPATAGELVAAPTPAVEDPAQASADAQDDGALARKHGLHLATGLPVVAAYYGMLTDEQIAAASRFFDFVELGLDPDLIEANPACWARTHLPKSESDRYLNTGVDTLGSPNPIHLSGEMVAWKGADEFEASRAREAFLSDHADALRADAVSMPLEVMVIGKRALPPYDAQVGGFPLFDRITSGGVSFGYLATYLGVATPRPVCLNDDFWFFPPAAKLPEIWAMDAVHAEQILKRLNQRTVYIAIALRFRAIPLAKMEEKYRPSNRIPVWSEVTSIATYEDADLERPIETLTLPKGTEPVVLSGMPEVMPVAASASFGEVSLALLLLRDHGDVFDAEAWRLLMLQQGESDQAYYDRRRDHETGAAIHSGETADYDARYVPFFPNGFGAGFQTQFPEALITRFKEWAMRRATNLPTEVVLHARIAQSGSEPPRLALPVADDNNPPGFVQPLLSQGYSVDQILRLDQDPTGMGGHFNSGYLAGSGKSRQPALILSNIASHYAPDFTDAERQQITEALRSGWPVVEIAVETGPSSLVPIDEKSEVFAVKGTPKRLAILDAGGVLYEKTYGEEALDPNRLDSAALAATPPQGEALPLSAEVVDLLVVKYLPKSVSDEAYDEMMVARWEYEATVAPERGEPDWGRFFVPGKPRPSDEQRAALLERFKDWTATRAAALPDKFRLHYRLVTLRDGNPLSAEAPYTPQDGDPNADSIMAQSCRAEAYSYPALAPACDYLEDVLRNAPSIHPFGLGYGLAGPRLSCATVLPDYREPYCKAREAQYEKVSSHKIEPGFRDIFVYDKEIFFPGTPSDVASLPTGTKNMIVEVGIAGVRVADKPLPKPLEEARKRYDALRRELGLGGSGWAAADEPPSGAYYVFDARVVSARLVEDQTHDPIADLALREARTLDLQALKLPDSEATLPDRTSGLDIVGLRLGMTFDEADSIIRSHMKVGRVLTRDRARDAKAVTGDFESFSSSKIYIAEDNSEFIVLYDEPPSTPDVVLGITRQINFAHGQMTPAAAMAQLRKKYGQENWTGARGGVGWGKGLEETTINDTLSHMCLPASGNRSARDWLEEDGSPTQWRPGSAYSVPNMTMFSNVRGRNCGPVLSMQFDVVNDASVEDRLVLHLTDPNLYQKHYEESKSLIQSGRALYGSDADAPDIKL